MEKYANLSREELIERLEKSEAGKNENPDSWFYNNEAIVSKTINLKKAIADILIVLLHSESSEAIDRALVAVMDFFDADRAYIHLYDWKNRKASLAFEVTRDRLFSIIEELSNMSYDECPWWCSHILRGKDIVIPCVAEMPPEAKNEKETLEFQEIVSLVALPLFSDGTVVASLGLDAVRTFRNWTSFEIENLRLFGEIILIALERGRALQQVQASEKLLRKSEENYRLKAIQSEELLTKLKLVMGMRDSLLWEYDVATDTIHIELQLIANQSQEACSLAFRVLHNKQDFWEVVYPADRQNVFDNHFERLLRGEIDHYIIQYRRLSALGYIWVEADVRISQRNPDGSPSKVLYYLTNIHERIQQQKRIDSLNQLMDLILKNVPVVIIVKDIKTMQYLYFNKAAENFTGLKFENVIGHTDYEIYTDQEFAQSVRDLDNLAIEKGEYTCYAADCKNTCGEIRVINSMRLVINDLSNQPEEPPLLVTLIWDITEERQKEIKLIKAQEADKLKSAFLANMSHEIRTPLNAIVGFSGILAETEDKAERQHFLSIIHKNNELLLQLINDILDFSKIESGKLDYSYEEVDLKDICREMFQIHSLKINFGVQLVFDEKNLPSVPLYTDPNRVSQIISNFLTNAIKFTQQGHIILSYQIQKEVVCVSVTDTGIGISEENLPDVFQRFVKLNEFKQGTGLGLAICRMLVNKLGGTIGVDSKLGVGSTFWFTLPLKEISEKKIEFPAQKNSLSEHKLLTGKEDEKELTGLSESQVVKEIKESNTDKKYILVAEDVRENYLLIKALLGKEYNLLHAWNGQEAVDLFEEYSPALVLMDLKMPVKDGFEATREIKAKSPGIPVVALSAFAFEAEKEKAIRYGFDDYLVKPFKVNELKQKVTNYIR
ncbi:hybrid sensor histidine kinase/response regulator [Parabacteroides pacaensis]|uniref:hybrid sensor histidine kinase/response regulator n=1 Tax=Parabacteroides pacaensis TaxID=2086575 RepID=UPI000D1149BD|nr:ATP-binding protein [Parabacteroides pacaensis]